MKKIFLDLDGTLAKFNVRNALKNFETKKGFFARLGAYVGIEYITVLINFYTVFIFYYFGFVFSTSAQCNIFIWNIV